MLFCNKCGCSANQCGGYLERVNEKGIPGIWECKPNCEAVMSRNEAILAAIGVKQ